MRYTQHDKTNLNNLGHKIMSDGKTQYEMIQQAGTATSFNIWCVKGDAILVDKDV